MMSAYRSCLLLALCAILAVSVNGASSDSTLSKPDTDAFKVWDAFKPYSRVKRSGPILGIVGTVIGNIFIFKSKIMKVLFDIVDIPLRWIDNMISSWANYFDNQTPGNHIKVPGWGIFSGLTTWILTGCLCLGLTLTVSTSPITQSFFSWLLNKKINSTIASVATLNDIFGIPQLFTRVMRHRGQHDNATGHHHTVSGSVHQLVVPTNETLSKRSVKRGEVNYFDNLTEQPMLSNSFRPDLNHLSIPRTMDVSNETLNQYHQEKRTGNLKKGKIIHISPSSENVLAKSLVTFRTVMRPINTANLLETGTHTSNHFPSSTASQSKQNKYLSIMKNARDGSLQSHQWKHIEMHTTESIRKRLEPHKRKRRRRMANGASKGALISKHERKQQVQEEATHRRRESAARRKEVRDEKLKRIKTKRLQLKNSGKTAGRLHTRERPSISEKMRENRKKVRDNEHKRPQSATKVKYRPSVHNAVDSKHKSRLKEKERIYGRKNCRKSVIARKKHSKASMSLQEKTCFQKGKRGNHNGDDHKHTSKAMSGKRPAQNSTEDEKSKVKGRDSKKKLGKKEMNKKPKSTQRKSRKSKKLHKENVVSKSTDIKIHSGTRKSGSEVTKEGDDDEHSSKETKSKKQRKSKKHEKGGSKNKKSEKKKNSHDEVEQNEETSALGEVGKVSKTKIKSSKKHISVVSEDSEEEYHRGEVSRGKHKKTKEQEERKHSQGKARKVEKQGKKDYKSKNSIQSSQLDKSSSHETDHSGDTSESASTEKSTKSSKKSKPIHKKLNKKKKKGKDNQTRKSNTGSTAKDVRKSGDEKHSNEIEYLGHVLGFGLANRKRSHSRTQASSRTGHKRPLTGGYASSGRLTRALSNLYGASASAGF